jgi:hypothetical protein
MDEEWIEYEMEMRKRGILYRIFPGKIKKPCD